MLSGEPLSCEGILPKDISRPVTFDLCAKRWVCIWVQVAIIFQIAWLEGEEEEKEEWEGEDREGERDRKVKITWQPQCNIRIYLAFLCDTKTLNNPLGPIAEAISFSELELYTGSRVSEVPVTVAFYMYGTI